jgi:hypothetical protein
MTNKQRREVEFYSQLWPDVPFVPSSEEIQDYIAATVHGAKFLGTRTTNRLYNNKRLAEITSKMWREGIREGVLAPKELREDPMYIHPFGQRLVDQAIAAALPPR